MDWSAAWGLGGLIGGSAVTWFFSRHYYLRSARERPNWANDLAKEVVDQYRSTHPEEDPGDFVAIFEKALGERGIVIDGGNF